MKTFCSLLPLAALTFTWCLESSHLSYRVNKKTWIRWRKISWREKKNVREKICRENKVVIQTRSYDFILCYHVFFVYVRCWASGHQHYKACAALVTQASCIHLGANNPWVDFYSWKQRLHAESHQVTPLQENPNTQLPRL